MSRDAYTHDETPASERTNVHPTAIRGLFDSLNATYECEMHPAMKKYLQVSQNVSDDE